MEALSEITSVCTANDLKMVVRLIKGDLRIQVTSQCFKVLQIFLIKLLPYLSSIVHTFYWNDAEILPAHYPWKIAFTNFIHKQSIQVKM